MVETLIKNLRVKASMISMGECIQYGSETELMNKAADALELMEEMNAALYIAWRAADPFALERPQVVLIQDALEKFQKMKEGK